MFVHVLQWLLFHLFWYDFFGDFFVNLVTSTLTSERLIGNSSRQFPCPSDSAICQHYFSLSPFCLNLSNFIFCFSNISTKMLRKEKRVLKACTFDCTLLVSRRFLITFCQNITKTYSNMSLQISLTTSFQNKSFSCQMSIKVPQK